MRTLDDADPTRLSKRSRDVPLQIHGKKAIWIVRYDQEYWRRLERNWRQWKGKRSERRETMKTIPEEEEIEEENSGVKKWTEEDDDEMGNMMDLCYEL